MLAYASRTGTKRNLAALREHGWRLLISAAGRIDPLTGDSVGFKYALDNGAWSAFAQGRPFDVPLFEKALRSFGADADWTVLPDVVAGGLPSLELSLKWMRRVLDETPRALLAVQDGMVPNDVRPFIGHRVGLFVGGSTDWKLKTMEEWGRLGRERECWVHVGRVNTARRIARCAAAGVRSFDGTSASKFSVTVAPLDRARRQLSLLGRT